MATEEVIGNTVVAVSDKPFRFEGFHSKCWQAKIKNFLTLQKVVNILTEVIPVAPYGSTEQTNGKNYVDSNENAKIVESAASDLQLRKENASWHENDYLCKNHIMNGLDDDMYDYYNNYKTTKYIWEALQKKYDTEEAGTKKYVISRYLKYQMVDERSVETQFH